MSILLTIVVIACVVGLISENIVLVNCIGALVIIVNICKIKGQSNELKKYQDDLNRAQQRRDSLMRK